MIKIYIVNKSIKMWKSLWKEWEKFIYYYLWVVLDSLKDERFSFKTFLWNYTLELVDYIWTKDWWTQLTDKVISLIFSRNKNILPQRTNLFIESKIYNSNWSKKSVEWSFQQFKDQLKIFWDMGYASIYIISRLFENPVSDYNFKTEIETNYEVPDYYFELTNEDFKNSSDLKKILEEISVESDKKNIKNIVKKYINNHIDEYKKIKEKVRIKLEQSFSVYENSPLRLKAILSELIKDKRNNLDGIDWIEDVENWFDFWIIQKIKEDIKYANKMQESYLLNKYTYFTNSLISPLIVEIEKHIANETFTELEDIDFTDIKKLSNKFIEEFNSVTMIEDEKKEVKDYLFEWGKKQKKGYLFNQWANKKCIFKYKSSNKINFISKINSNDK